MRLGRDLRDYVSNAGGVAMPWYDGITPTSEHECFNSFLSSCGYDQAKRYGLLRQYMKMMNEGPSGGYTDHHFEQAAISDSIVHSFLWRQKEHEYCMSLTKKPPA